MPVALSDGGRDFAADHGKPQSPVKARSCPGQSAIPAETGEVEDRDQALGGLSGDGSVTDTLEVR